MTEWISVRERLPEIGETVWACFKGQFRWVHFLATMTPYNGLFDPKHAEPTHWRPLPEPPEETE